MNKSGYLLLLLLGALCVFNGINASKAETKKGSFGVSVKGAFKGAGKAALNAGASALGAAAGNAIAKGLGIKPVTKPITKPIVKPKPPVKPKLPIGGNDECVLCQYYVQRLYGLSVLGPQTGVDIMTAFVEVESTTEAKPIAPKGPIVDGRARTSQHMMDVPAFGRYGNNLYNPILSGQGAVQHRETVLAGIQQLCNLRTPQKMMNACSWMYSQARIIADGIWYGDRPDRICMKSKICSTTSYVASAPHTSTV